MKSSVFPLPNAKALLGIAWAALLAVLVAVAVDSIVVKPGTDASIYIYVAQGILEGEIPYLDRWDHKGPLLYVLNLCGLLIHGTWGPWLVQGIFLFGASAFAFLALRLAFGTVPAFFAIALLLTLFTPPGNLPGQYGLLFQCLTLYLFVRSQEQSEPTPSRRSRDSLHLAIGALGAASFLLRPNLVTLWLVIGLYWLVASGISWRKLAWAVSEAVPSSSWWPVSSLRSGPGTRSGKRSFSTTSPTATLRSKRDSTCSGTSRHGRVLFLFS